MGKYSEISETNPIIEKIIKEHSRKESDYISRDDIISSFINDKEGGEIAKKAWEKCENENKIKPKKKIKFHNKRELVGNMVDWFSKYYNEGKEELNYKYKRIEEDGTWSYKTKNDEDKQEKKTQNELNYWLFQGNPEVYNYYKDFKENKIDQWTVSAYKDKIDVGDKVILWLSGSNRGCYGLAEIANSPHKPNDGNELKVSISLTHNLINHPISYSKISSEPELENINVGNQGTNFSATEDEYKKLLEIANKYKEMENNIRRIKMNQILYGPPGTGKTYKTIEKAVKIIDYFEFKEIEDNRDLLKIRFEELKENGQIEFVTFHQSFGYEEFVEGIRPVMEDDNNEIEYDIKPGVFKKICERAIDNTDENYVIIIDEINRGNISKIFGEIITLIETDKRKENDEELGITLPYSKKQFYIPNNLYIIGTMNTADRSIALLDTALRRRFHFKEIMPNSTLLENISIKNIDLKKLFEKINERIEYLYDRDHQIGHSYFLKLKDNLEFSELKSIFKNKIIPLLQEYFYDDWEKIQIILNEHYRQLGKSNEVVKFDDEINKDRIIQSKQCIEKNIIGFDHNFIDDNKVIYRINPELNNLEPNAFTKIYE